MRIRQLASIVLASALLASGCASAPPATRPGRPSVVIVHNVLQALLGKSPTGRDHLVEHAGTLALVRGDWKYIQPGKGQKTSKNTNTELGNDPGPQLYDLKTDPGEQHNVAADHGDVVSEMSALLQKIRKQGRSRPQAP